MERGAPVALLAVQILFGLFPIAAKKVFVEFDPFPLLAVRLGGAAFCLLVLHLLLVRHPIPIRKEWPAVLGLSLLGVVFNMALFITGLQYTTSLNAVVVITTIPVFTYGLAVLMGRESWGPRRALGIALALAGVAVLVFGSYQASPEHALGDVLIMLNSLSYSAFLVFSRPMVQKYDALSLVTWMCLIGAIVFVPLGVAGGLRGQFAGASDGVLAWLAFIVIGATVLTYLLNTMALRHVSASTVAAFTYVQPIFTAVAAYFLLGEEVSLKVLPAAALVFAGVWLVARRKPKVLEGAVPTE